MIVSLHVASGAAACAATRSRLLAVLLGVPLHLLADRVPHRDIPNRTFEIASGLAGLSVLALGRGPFHPATLGALAASSAKLRSRARRGDLEDGTRALRGDEVSFRLVERDRLLEDRQGLFRTF